MNTIARWQLVALLALLAGLGVLSFDRASRGRFDFHHFYLDARYVWEHGALNPAVTPHITAETRQLPFYLPVVSLALAPLAALGRLPAAVLWTVGQMAALAYAMCALRRWTGLVSGRAPARPSAGESSSPPTADQGVGRYALPLAVVLALPAFIEAARFNQVSYFVLALVIGGFTGLERGRDVRAGVFFGLAAVLKLLPGLFLVWLLLKRRWTAAAVCLLTALIVIVLPPLLVFGPGQTWTYHREWFDYNLRGDAGRGLLRADLPEHFIDRRNQSIAQVLARLTWPQHPYRTAWQPVALESQTCQRIAAGVTLTLLLTLVWKTRRPWDALTSTQRQAEAAAYALAMLALSPLVRQYYLVWALPALVWFAQRVLEPLIRTPHASAGQNGPALNGRARMGSACPPSRERKRADELATARAVGSDPGRRIAHGDSAWRVRMAANCSAHAGPLGLAVWLIGMAVWPWPAARVVGVHLAMLLLLGGILVTVATAGAEGYDPRCATAGDGHAGARDP